MAEVLVQFVHVEGRETGWNGDHAQSVSDVRGATAGACTVGDTLDNLVRPQAGIVRGHQILWNQPGRRDWAASPKGPNPLSQAPLPVEAIFTDCERILGSGHPLTMISPENLRAARRCRALGEEGMAANHSVIIKLDLNVSLPDLARDTAIRQPKPV